jgi:hypothetical protein
MEQSPSQFPDDRQSNGQSEERGGVLCEVLPDLRMDDDGMMIREVALEREQALRHRELMFGGRYQ